MATRYCENITQHIIIKGFILWILVLITGKTQCWSDYHCPHFTAKVISSRWHTHSVAEQAVWPESTLSPFSAPSVTFRVKSTLLPKTFTHSSSIVCVIKYNSRQIKQREYIYFSNCYLTSNLRLKPVWIFCLMCYSTAEQIWKYIKPKYSPSFVVTTQQHASGKFRRQ